MPPYLRTVSPYKRMSRYVWIQIAPGRPLFEPTHACLLRPVVITCEVPNPAVERVELGANRVYGLPDFRAPAPRELARRSTHS